jgi:hypothetical protein
MSEPSLSFQFKIDIIRERNDAPSQSFSHGAYKPPVERDHCEQLNTTGWCQWTMNGISATNVSPPPMHQAYSTSVFYDAIDTKRFLFHPADCQTTNISAVEKSNGERWGWQQLCFSHKDIGHAILDLDGEFGSLNGRGGSYIPHFMPPCYQSIDEEAVVGLSGRMSLLLALTAFSCRPEHILNAIRYRMNFKERRWHDINIQDWGIGRRFCPHPTRNKTLTFHRSSWSRSGGSYQRRWFSH